MRPPKYPCPPDFVDRYMRWVGNFLTFSLAIALALTITFQIEHVIRKHEARIFAQLERESHPRVTKVSGSSHGKTNTAPRRGGSK